MGNKKSNKPGRTARQPKEDRLGPIESLLEQRLESERAETIYEPSDEALARLSVIPLLFEEPATYTSRMGRIAFDSWAEGPAVSLRDVADGHIRRIRLRAGKVSLEIVAERSKGRWEFVARVYRGSSVMHNFVMSIGRKKLLSESGGFFRWTSKAVPHRIGLASFRQTYTFERVPW